MILSEFSYIVNPFKPIIRHALVATMDKFLNILFVILFVSTSMVSLLGQKTPSVDDVKQRLQEVQSSDDRVYLYKVIYSLLRFSDPMEAEVYYNKIDSISKQENNLRAKGSVAHLSGLEAMITTDFDQAKEGLLEALDIYEEVGMEMDVSDAYNDLGILKTRLSQWDSARYFMGIAYEIRKTIDDIKPYQLYMTAANIGAISVQINDYDTAFEHYYEGVDLAEAYGDTFMLATLYNNIGRTHHLLEEDEEAKSALLRAVLMGSALDLKSTVANASTNLTLIYEDSNLDSAIYYINIAIDNYRQLGDSKHEANALGILGEMLYQKKDIILSEKYMKMSLDLNLELGDESAIADSRYRLAKLQFDQGLYSEALSNVESGEQIYTELGRLEKLKKGFLLKSKALSKLKRSEEALLAYQDYDALEDSLYLLKYNEDVADIRTRYDTEKKQIQIEKQEEVIKRQEASQRALIVGSVLLFSLVGLGLSFIIQRHRKNKRIVEQEAALKDQEIQQLKQEKKILSMNAMIEGQEAERTRIAKDLHDGLGGLLSTVKAHFSNIQSEIKQLEGLKVYDRAQEMMDEACDEVRRISHNMMPGALRLEGLISAVEQLGEEMSDAHLFEVKVEAINFDTRLEESKEIFVYRIIQEAMNNIIKHAAAKRVLIQMSESADQYHFIIEDDGKGFDPLEMESGLGLRSIQSRVEFLQGDLDIDTKLQVGTTISFSLPKP